MRIAAAYRRPPRGVRHPSAVPSGNTRRLRFLADDHDDVSLRLVGQKLFAEVV